MADDLLSTLGLARACPLAIAPAMNQQMWQQAATQRNVCQLAADGVSIWGPAEGEQACGEIGPGRMLEPAEILREVETSFAPKLLVGRHVVVTAGPTYEALDPVRGITNLSSGKMGYAIARAAQEAGAKVTLISGPTGLQMPAKMEVVRVNSALEMRNAVLSVVPGSDVFISVAAVADYRPAEVAKQKIKKQDGPTPLTLIANPDILAEVAALPTPPFCVGFAAETENLEQNARAKRALKNLPLIVANRADLTLNQDEAELFLYTADAEWILPRGPKSIVARSLISHIASLL